MREENGRFTPGHKFSGITRFQPGNRVRANFTQRKEAYKEALRRLLNSFTDDGLSIADKLAMETVTQALSGDEMAVTWMKLIHDTVDGSRTVLEVPDEPDDPDDDEISPEMPQGDVIDVELVDPPRKLTKPKEAKQGRFNAWLKKVSPDRDWDAPHLVLLQSKVELVNSGHLRRLIVSMPPRHGKSELLSIHAPVWLLEQNPKREIITAGWGVALSRKFTRKARLLAERIGMPLSSKVAQAGQWETAEGGAVFAVGVKGGVAGYGADILICDDPVKDVKEANSPLQRERVWDWFTSEAMTRLSPNGAAIVIMTRRHESDLIGSLVEGRDAETGEAVESEDVEDRWEYISLPAISEGDGDAIGRPEGAALWPTRFSLAKLAKIRETVGSWIWAALYQQRPSPRSGGLFQQTWFSQFVDVAPAGPGLKWVRYWDKASTVDGGDYTVGVLMCEWDGKFYVTDVVRAQVSPQQRRILQRQCAEMDPRGTVCWIEHEGGSAGKDAAELEARELAGFAVRHEHPTGSKEVRADPFAAQCEAGNVILVRAKWNRKYIEELCTFPNAKHDDQVDASSGAFGKLAVKRRIRVVGGRDD
jgi:predicted phage terminase large subunit-like protein